MNDIPFGCCCCSCCSFVASTDDDVCGGGGTFLNDFNASSSIINLFTSNINPASLALCLAILVICSHLLSDMYNNSKNAEPYISICSIHSKSICSELFGLVVALPISSALCLLDGSDMSTPSNPINLEDTSSSAFISVRNLRNVMSPPTNTLRNIVISNNLSFS